MSQQKRIDQFYPIISIKRTSNVMNIKKHSRTKEVPYTKNRKKQKNENSKVSFTQDIIEPNSMFDCTVVYEKINEMHDTCSSDIEMIQNDDKIVSYNMLLDEDDYLKEIPQHMLDTKCETLPMLDTASKVKEKTLTANETCIVTSNNKLESFSNFNQIGSLKSNDMQFKKMPRRKLKNNSPVKSSIPTIDNNFYSRKTPNKKPRTPDKNNFLLRNSNSSFSTPEKLNYTSRVPSGKSPKSIARKRLFGEIIDTDIITQAIECMNLAKQGAIPLHNFNLEEIYSKSTFNYQYKYNINTKISMKYETNDINLCDDLNSKILFTIIFSVFSNPINCGYFDESELDFIYSIMTLPRNAQMLLARMIKRKRKWFRKSGIDYPDIAKELKDTFKILVSRSICTFDISNENLFTILELLNTEEIYKICKKMKTTNPKRNKKINIQELLKLSKKKPLFPGAKAPSSILYTSIFDVLDYCVCITTKTWNIIDRVITLLIPNQDPTYDMADTFRMLCDIYLEKTIFPNFSRYYFPVFSSTLHLINYIEAKSTLFRTLQHIEKKNWKNVQKYGNLAMDILSNLLQIESLRLENSMLPMCVRRYFPGYIWLKILSKCIDAFKKDKDKKRVIEVLSFLLKQDCHMHAHKGKWYAELALIQMYHHKDIEASASTITQALNVEENLTQVDKVNLMERANKILKKKTGIKPSIKVIVNKVLDDHDHHMPKYKAAATTIYATVMPSDTAGNKSVWRIENNTESQSYGSVETVALHYYYKQGFPSGLHCESTVPIILFFTLFWDELYDIHIPGAFVSPYQNAPDDLFTEQFYENRKEKIDMKLQIIGDYNSESLGILMEEKFNRYKQYQSIMSSNLQDNLQIKEIVCCLGAQGVIGICKRLIDNFKLWKAGFPDLIVWNYYTKEHKIVEVKGPRDILSTKQQLWLNYLHQLGLNTEVCLVKDKCSAKSRKEDTEIFDDYE